MSFDGTFAKASAINQRLQALNDARQAIYAQAFGTKKAPVGAAARVASKRIQLVGLTQSGRNENDGQELSDMPALDALRDVVAALPEDVRIKLLKTRIETRQLTLRGQTARHRDAERIAEAVGSVQGLTSRPPRTSRLKSGGVEFSIVASRGVTHE